MPIDIRGNYSEFDPTDTAEYAIRSDERENLRLWGSKSSPTSYVSAKMNPDGSVTRTAMGKVSESDFTGPLKAIYEKQYGSWEEYNRPKSILGSELMET